MTRWVCEHARVISIRLVIEFVCAEREDRLLVASMSSTRMAPPLDGSPM